MARTEDLIDLMGEFPAAFADPESAAAASSTSTPKSELATTDDKTQALLILVDEFPQAFADPEAPQTQTSILETQTPLTPVAPTQVVEPALPSPQLPAGYTQALHRRLSTISWGQVDCELIYGQTGLERIWITVGKSGTEVQSLCEAIARLVNLLLAQAVPILEIVKELRGIRGGDAEGFGPHRILGLADLIGKVLQEAPVLGTAAVTTTTTVEPVPVSQPAVVVEAAIAAVVSVPTVESLSTPHDHAHSESDWVSLPTDSRHSASLCPDCGAELLQMNGCSGGACNVCGYSSCS